MELSLIIPACNEEKRIQATLESYVSYLQSSGITYEIIVEMDGCTDGTADIVRKMGNMHPHIKALEFKERLGKGGGLLKGFDEATGDIIGFVDADGSIPPEEMMKILNAVRNGSDCAIGSRRMKGAEVSNQNGVRRTLSKCFNIMVRTLFFMPYKDTQCGAKVYRAKALRKVLSEIHVNGFIFDVVLLYLTKKNGFSVAEIPIKWEDKVGSKVNVVSTTMDMFSSVLKLRVYYSPLRKFLNKNEKKPSKKAEMVRSPRY